MGKVKEKTKAEYLQDIVNDWVAATAKITWLSR